MPLDEARLDMERKREERESFQVETQKHIALETLKMDQCRLDISEKLMEMDTSERSMAQTEQKAAMVAQVSMVTILESLTNKLFLN